MQYKSCNLQSNPATLAAWLLLGSTACFAQVSGPASKGDATGTNANSAASATALEEIVVTAEKRAEFISKVGMTITAFNGDTLRAQGINSVADLAEIVPGLTYAHSNTDTPVYTLRGVGFYETSLAAYPAVSVYIDQMPLAFPFLTSHTDLDLERVEVLKGPQGILFGQNSTGGAINFIAAKPTDHFSQGFDLTYGRFNRAQLDGFISGPLGGSVTARFALSEEHGGDWQQSYTRNDTLGAMQTFNSRLILDWRPVDQLRFEANINGWIDHSDPQAAQFYALDLQLPKGASPALLNYPTAPADPRAADWGSGNARPHGDEDLWQVSLRTEYDVSDRATITSLSSYVRARRNDVLDPDGIALNDYGLVAVGSLDSFSQELRIANGSDNRLRYTFGGNFERDIVDDNGQLSFVDSTLTATYGFAHNGLVSNQTMSNSAVFGNVDFAVTDQWTLKGGARYTKSDRSDDGCSYDPGDGQIAGFFTYLSSLVRGTPTTPIKPGGCITLNKEFLPTQYQATLDQSNVSWRVGTDFKPSDTVLLYGNIAKGYKAGSFPNAAASTTAQLAPVTQESILDYEGGFKAQLFHEKASLNGAIFYYDYTDKQIRSKLVDPVFGVLDALVNIPKSSIKGAELSFEAAPFQGLRTNLAVTYLDSVINQFIGVNGAGITSNFAGSSIPFTPKFTANAGMTYSWELPRNLTGFAGANVTYNAKTYSVVGNDPITLIKSYALLDLRIGLETQDQKWRLQLWGKNVTNEYYWTNAIVVYDTQVRYAGMPATFGVTVSYRY